jgi:DNA-binding response OmpR family regulator
MAKVQIVDDDVQATNLIREVLLVYNYETVVVNDSAMAVAVAKLVHPDIFVLDLMMPPPDGFKLCRMLRAEPEFKETPILIVTALGDTDSRIVAMGAGANDYLAKPFGIEDLAARVQNLLDRPKPASPSQKETGTS